MSREPASDMSNFSTQRMRVRHWDAYLRNAELRAVLERDIEAAVTAKVVKFLPKQLALESTHARVADWIAERDESSEVSVISAEHSEEFLGLLFLMNAPSALSIGYLFKEGAWGRGYASELVAGLIEHLEGPNRPKLRGGVAHENEASARVLLKNGFQRNKSLSTRDIDMFER